VNNELQSQIGPDGTRIPMPVEPGNINRSILADTPVVTRYDIAWDDNTEADALKSFMQQNSKLGEVDEAEEEDRGDEEEDEDEDEEEEEEDVQGGAEEEDIVEEEEDEPSEIDLEEADVDDEEEE
jgi:hypothetical protein